MQKARPAKGRRQGTSGQTQAVVHRQNQLLRDAKTRVESRGSSEEELERRSVKSIHHTRHSRERGNPDFPQSHLLKVWIPTFVGKTIRERWFQLNTNCTALSKQLVALLIDDQLAL